MDDSDCETVSCSTKSSRWSSPCCGPDGPQRPSECERRTDGTPVKKYQGVQKREMLKLPPVRPPEDSKKPPKQSANISSIWALKSQIWNLQEQLSEARAENQLLKKAQHRHTVAQQHLIDSEDSISQILAKHRNETKALQTLLRETSKCRDNLARQLQATERKLLSKKNALQHLQQLNQDNSLLEREELALRLARANTQLEEKDQRIKNMERSLELHQESFKRQIEVEQRKVREARNTSSGLQQYILLLNNQLQLREKQVQKHNIYYHRFVKGPSKKGRENKTVQTDELLHIHKETPKPQNTRYDNQAEESLLTEKPETFLKTPH